MNKDVWLFPQNSCDITQFFITLNVFGKLNGISRKDNVQHLLMEQHSLQGKYNPYIEKDHYDLSSANHKIDEPRFYGAIYETPNKKIHVSSHGELLIKYQNDEEKRSKIFISMLSNIQFDNPYKKMQYFDIYPLRLLFGLLTEETLGKKITNLEVASILYYIKNVNTREKYTNIVEEILKFREKNISEKIKVFSEDSAQFVKNFVSCNYMFKMLTEMGITNHKKDNINIKLKSPLRIKPTAISERTIEIKKEYLDFVTRLLNENSIYETIKRPNGLRSDWIRDIYNTVPEILLTEIEEKESIYTEYLQIPQLLVETSIDSTKWSKFEEYITKSFNLFVDVNAETIGGPGQPDSLCHFTKEDIIFCADGKSTSKKLSSINDGRLKQHRKLYNAKYTIIVTPGYVPSAVEDIRGTETCIITSHCFADLITKYIFKLYQNKEECSYDIIHQIIMENLGCDISEQIYSIIDNRLGITINNL